MSVQREHLLHDLTALYAFIENVVAGAAFKSSSTAYGPAAVEFLKFVSDLAESCKQHIAGWLSEVDHDEEFEDRRQELGEIRKAWQELHALIKPAFDADTLQVPSAVVDGIVRRFQELPGHENAKFALFHTAEFNYVAVRTEALRTLAKKLRAIIPNAPMFPPDLGLIGIPYSQSRTAFANCLVAHEIGHHLYQGTAVENILRPMVNTALAASFPAYEKEDQPNKDSLVKAVTRWAEEIFCDIFGIALLGPCYTYAYIEAYDLSVVLDSAGKISEERIRLRTDFYERHPSHVFRLQQQAMFLHESPWWDHMASRSARYVGLLQAVDVFPMEAHIQINPKLGSLVPALNAVMPEVRRAIGAAFDGVDDGFASFSKLNPTVQDYLANGIVPSTLNIRTGKRPDDTKAFPASPFVLLNSGMEFYLTRTNQLIKSISGEDVTAYPRRLH